MPAIIASKATAMMRVVTAEEDIIASVPTR